MITNPWTFSFPDAVHFNFHLALTLNLIPVFFQNVKPLNDLTSIFKRVVVKAGFDPRRITHHCNRLVSSFSLTPIETYESDDFALREDAKSWPLLCHADNSSGKINVSLKSHIISVRVSFFSAWLKSACYAGLTTVEKLGRKLFRGVRTSQTCFNCQ